MGCTQVSGRAPAERGIDTGSRPDGAACGGNRNECGGTLFPWEKQLDHCRGSVDADGPVDHVRPTGEHPHQPRAVDTTASMSSRRTPDNSSDSTSLPSPTVSRPNNPALSPTTTTAVPAARAASRLQQCRRGHRPRPRIHARARLRHPKTPHAWPGGSWKSRGSWGSRSPARCNGRAAEGGTPGGQNSGFHPHSHADPADTAGHHRITSMLIGRIDRGPSAR